MSTTGSQYPLVAKPALHCYKVSPKFWKGSLAPKSANPMYFQARCPQNQNLTYPLVLGLLHPFGKASCLEASSLFIEMHFLFQYSWWNSYSRAQGGTSVSQGQFLEAEVVSTCFYQALRLQPHFPVPQRSSWTYSWYLKIQRSNEMLNLQYLWRKINPVFKPVSQDRFSLGSGWKKLPGCPAHRFFTS